MAPRSSLLRQAFGLSLCAACAGQIDDNGTDAQVPDAAADAAATRCSPAALRIVDDAPNMYRHDVATDGLGTLYSAVSSDQRVFVRTSSDDGATWIPTADVPYGTNRGRVVMDVAADRTIYVATTGDDANGVRRAVLLRSAPPWQTWTPLDEFDAIRLFGLHIAASGDVFISGTGAAGAAAVGWFIRGGSAATSFTFRDHLPGAQSSIDENRADAVASDALGNLFAAGIVFDGANLVWTVRKSSNGGVAWQTVDSYESTPAMWALAVGIAVADDGSLVVAGEAGESVSGTPLNRWLVRASPAGGTSWTTVHRLPATGNPSIFAGRDVAAGAGQRRYAIGYQGSTNEMGSDFVLTGSTDGGTTWGELGRFPFTGSIRTELIADRVIVASDGAVYASRSDAIRAMCPE